MNRLLQRVFVVLAAAFAGLAILVAKSAQMQGVSLLTSKTFFGALVLVLFFLVAAFKLKTEWKFRIFMLVCLFVLVELSLQATTWLGLVRGINTKVGCPYARVYWTSEGLGNSIRNRLGWYAPEFDLQPPRRIAVIGDSFVEAVEVPRTRNHAVLLQQRLRQDSPDWAVLGLGTHGTSPAFHIEVLEYAQKYFQPREAVIYVYLGNDIAESLPALVHLPPASYIYYDLDKSDQLVLNPESAASRAYFVQHLELNHATLLASLPLLLTSHCMTIQAVLSARDALFRRRRQTQLRAMTADGQTNNAAARQLGELGINPAPFAIQQSAEVKLAMQVMERELERCQEICDHHGIRLRLVTIPAFPKVFYDTQKGRDWTARIGDYDYLGPERELISFAKAKGIQLFPLGDYIQGKRLDVEEIRRLYFFNGVGHFTEQGHRFCADAVYEAFYRNKQP